MTGNCWNNYLADNTNFVYPQLKENLDNNDHFQFCLSSAQFLTNAGWSDLFIGKYDENDIKVQYYVTALCSLLMTMESNWSDVKAAQAMADATMTWNDYVIEIETITAKSLSVYTAKMGGMWSDAFNVCGLSIDVISNTIDTLEDY